MDSFWLLIKFIIAAIIMAAFIIIVYGELSDVGMRSGQAIKTKEPQSGLLKPPKKPSW
jgi:hypothetical protein